MTEIYLKTELTQTDCIAELSCILNTQQEHRKKYSCKRMASDSAQRAELKAIITGLREIRCPAKVFVYLWSNHLAAATRNDWPANWKKNGWKNQKGHLVRDWELWKEIVDIVEKKQLVLVGGN